MTRYLIYFDDDGGCYYHRIGLGIFWECGGRKDAKIFSTRTAAAKVLHINRKHLQGWRIITEKTERAQ